MLRSTYPSNSKPHHRNFLEWFRDENTGSQSDKNGVHTIETTAIQRGGMGLSSLNFNTRVQRGKGVEERIKQALAAHGIEVTPPTAAEDMYDKIDGYIKGQPVQIKYRDTGEDILYELIKPHDRFSPFMPQINQNPGRDFKGKAMYYIVLSQDGTKIYIIPTRHIKALVLQAALEIGDKPLERSYQSSWGIDFRAVSDPANRQLQKVNVFIPPRVFGSIAKQLPVKT